MEPAKAKMIDATIGHNGNPEVSTYLTPASEAGVVQIRIKTAPLCVPIFPLRYGWVDEPYSPTLLPNVDTSLYPEAAATETAKHWGPRLLRPHSFVYMAYTQRGEQKLKGFQVEADGRFTALPCALSGECDAHIRTLPYLPAPAAEVENVYLFVVDTELTANKIKEVLSGKVEAGYTSFADWLGTYATPVTLDAETTQPHVFKTQYLITVPELARDRNRRLTGLAWSESLVNGVSGDDLIKGMSKVQGTSPTSPGLAVVLHDPVGAISEANFTLETLYAELQEWAEENAYRQFSAEIIEGFVRQARQEQASSARQNDPVLGAAGAATGGAVLAAHKSAVQAGEEAAQALKKFYRHEAMTTWVNHTFPAEQQEFVQAIELALETLDKVFLALQAPYEATLALYDVQDTSAFTDLRMVASHTLSGLAHCKQGSEWLVSQLPESGPEGLLGQILWGHPSVKQTVAELADLLFSAGDEGANAYANRLLETLKTVQADAHSRQISGFVAMLVRNGKLADANAFMQSVYRVVLELLDGEIIHHQRVAKKDLPQYLRKQMGERGIKAFAFSMKETNKAYRQTMNLWEAEDLTQTFAKELGAEKSLSQKVRFWSNANVGLSGTATLLSVFNVEATLSELSQEDGMTFINVLAASGALVGSGAAVAGLSEAAHLRAQRLALLGGNEKKAKILEREALKAEKQFIGFMTATAALMALKNITEGREAKGDAKFFHYSIASVQSVVAASGFLYLAKGSQSLSGDIYRRAFSRLESGGATSRRLAKRLTRFSTPKPGWLLLASTATTALELYLSVHNEKSKITDWIAKSAWGTQRSLGRLYDDYSLAPFEDEEAARLALYGLHHAPVVHIEKNHLRHDEVVVYLAGYQPQVSGYEIKQFIMRPFTTLEQAYKNVDTSDLPSAKPITVGLEDGRGVIRFPTVTGGKVFVRYWPNAFSQPNVVLKGES